MGRTACALLATLFLCLTATAARGAGIIEPRQHKNWTSFILAAEKLAMARMVTNEAGRKDGVQLALEFFPQDSCAPPKLVLLSGKGSSADTEIYLTVKGAVRVDERKIHPVEYKIVIEKNATTYQIATPLGGEFLYDAMYGQFVRFKIELDEGGRSSYMRFSLAGFAEALKRAQTLCAAMGKTPTEEKEEPGKEPARETPPENPRRFDTTRFEGLAL